MDEVMSTLIMVGWRERVALPDLDLPTVRAKIDTGARSSSLHVERQRRFVEQGAPWVAFLLRLKDDRTVEAQAAVHDEREVVDSGGHRTIRAFLCTRLVMGGVERKIEVNLTDRRDMRFPMLIGRSALSGVFTVDPARSFLHGRAARRSPSEAFR